MIAIPKSEQLIVHSVTRKILFRPFTEVYSKLYVFNSSCASPPDVMAKLCDDDVNILTIKPIDIKPESAHDPDPLHIYTMQEENCAAANFEPSLLNSSDDFRDEICGYNMGTKSEEIEYKDCSIAMSVKQEWFHFDNNNTFDITTAGKHIKQENHNDINKNGMSYDIYDASGFTPDIKSLASIDDFVAANQTPGCDDNMRSALLKVNVKSELTDTDIMKPEQIYIPTLNTANHKISSDLSIQARDDAYNINSAEIALPSTRPMNNGLSKLGHMRHMGPHEKPYVCPHCNKSISTVSSLRVHMMTHNTEKPYTCPPCNRNFTKLGYLMRHMGTHENPDECPHCNKRISTVSSLKVHMMTHATEKPYTCPHCNESFTYACRMERHMKTHTSEKPHACSQCNKSYAYVHHLKRHMMIHSGEKPHTCPQCNKSFAQASSLKMHLIIHSGEKPHICPQCKQCFALAGNMKTHMVIHSGKKPHICPHCKKCFALAGNMKQHMIIHSGRKPH